MSASHIAVPFPDRSPPLYLTVNPQMGVEGCPAFRLRACRSVDSLLEMDMDRCSPTSSDGGDQAAEYHLDRHDARDSSGGSEGNGGRLWSHRRCKSDITDLIRKPPPQIPIITIKQLVIKMGEREDIFDVWGCEIDEWLRPNWAKIWDSFDFSQDPIIHLEVPFAQQPKDVQMLAVIIALEKETPLFPWVPRWDLWCKAGPEGRIRLGQLGWDMMVGFWATHSAAVINYIGEIKSGTCEPFPWLDLAFTHFASGWWQEDHQWWYTHVPERGTAGPGKPSQAHVLYKGRGLFNTRIPFPRRAYRTDEELFQPVWAGWVVGNPVRHLTEARIMLEQSGYRAFGDHAFRAALLVIMIGRLGYHIIKPEAIHPLQQPQGRHKFW